jgi:ribonuclease E
MASKHGPDSNLILINATQAEEIRVAITSGRYLDNLFIEEMGSHRTGNIYKARITRVVPSLQAAFVDFGSERHGFLPLKEIGQEYFRSSAAADHGNIADLVSEGQEIIVQVVKEERGTKGAALTTFITLAGCYLVLMPNNPAAGGISRRIEGEDRDQMREYINALSLPDGMGLIIRTAGVGRAQEELEWDLDILLRLWEAINQAAASRNSPFLIHQESDIVIRALRDYLRRDIDEIIIDSPELYERAKHHISKIRPEFADLIKLYQDKAVPLFTRYRIEDQIESAFLREVELPSGGFIVIEETEAMVTIDVNSARDTKGGNIEQTAFNTNREAAIEVARQLRLRDIGGLIAIDFIDMISNENQQKIVDVFKDETRNDKARVQFNRISRFGILEVSRQRLRPSLTESSQIVCPRCNGQGSIRSIESLGLLLLRLIRQEALHDNVVAVNVQAPIEVATFLINEKRHALLEIETQHHIMVRIFPNPHIQTPQYKIERVYENQTGQTGVVPSFKQIEKVEFQTPAMRSTNASSRYSEPAIKEIDAPAKPIVTRKQGNNLLTRLWSILSGNTPKVAEVSEQPAAVAEIPEKKRRHRGQRQRGQRQNQGQGQGQSQHQGQSQNMNVSRQQSTSTKHHSRHEKQHGRQAPTERETPAIKTTAEQSYQTPPQRKVNDNVEPIASSNTGVKTGPKQTHAPRVFANENRVTASTTPPSADSIVETTTTPNTRREAVITSVSIIVDKNITPLVKSNETSSDLSVESGKKPAEKPVNIAKQNETVTPDSPAIIKESVPAPMAVENQPVHTAETFDFPQSAQPDATEDGVEGAVADDGTGQQRPKRHSRHYRNRYRQRSNHYRRGNRTEQQREGEPAQTAEADSGKE